MTAPSKRLITGGILLIGLGATSLIGEAPAEFAVAGAILIMTGHVKNSLDALGDKLSHRQSP